MCGCQPKGYGANFGSQKRCQICDAYTVETMEHILFSCDALREVRTTVLSELMDSMPGAMRKSFCELSNKRKLEFILSGLGSDTYIEEWQYVYIKTCCFVHSLYRERAARYKRLDEIVI